jgi:tRNA(Leu) C34 or U34 (ribose-2'-O)-methylase TrmL
MHLVLLERATSLPAYKHREWAFYIFGSEDATLGRRMIGRCTVKAMVPNYCSMNSEATVNVILCDRLAKISRQRTSEAEI